MGKIINVCKKLLGKELIINPIMDPFSYNGNQNSFSGGSLEERNLLIVVSCQSSYNSVKDWVSTLGAKVAIKTQDYIIDDIASSSATLIGPFTNIINIIFDTDSKNSNQIYSTYNLLQIESNYLIEVTNKGFISTAFVSENNERCKAVESLIKGLSLALGGHGVIENGLTANSSVQQHDILNALSYLNSKYGYILAGEVLTMSEDEGNE